MCPAAIGLFGLYLASKCNVEGMNTRMGIIVRVYALISMTDGLESGRFLVINIGDIDGG